jgi:membrane metallo-endopeptidase-like protein 1
VKNFFNKSDKRRVTELTLDVKRAFLGTLRKVEWMDEDTKKRALLKAEKINSFIAYPDEILDDHKVEEYYSGVGSSVH